MTISDCFRILELPRNACLDDLKVAYRSQAKKYHPDRTGGNSRKFTLLHEAYTFLLDYGVLKPGNARDDSGERIKGEAEERARREAHRRASDEKRERLRREAAEKAAFEKKRRDLEKKAAERRAAYEKTRQETELKTARERARKMTQEKSTQKKINQSGSHKVFIAGEVLKRDSSDREKIAAIHALVLLKRKSAYPFLKKALYSTSERIVLTSIDAIGKIKIIQAGPELGSLMISGSLNIKKAILDAVSVINNKNYYRNIIDIGLNEKNILIKDKAEVIYKRIYE